MDCPKCGYVLDPFETSCPRCARQGDTATSAAATATAPPPPKDQDVAAAIDKIAPKVQGGVSTAPQQSEPGQPPVRRPRQSEVIQTGPELGWPLTILLWAVIAFHAGLLLYLTIIMLAAQSEVADNYGASTFVGGLGLIAAFPLLIRIAAAIGMLKCQRWGFYLFLVFVVGQVGYSLMSGEHNLNLLDWFAIVTGAPIFIMVLMKWEEFD